MGPYASYLVETLVTLIVVVGVAAMVVFGARKLGVGRGHGPLRLRGHLPLDARRGVYLVEVGSHVLVIGASEAGLTRLGEVDATTLPAPAPRSEPFAKVLARIRGNAGDAGGDAS